MVPVMRRESAANLNTALMFAADRACGWKELSMRILVVEDEERVAHFIQKGLKEEGHAVDVSYDGEDGEFLAEVNDYDLIILDLMLPNKNGIVVCRELRASGVATPVLMLTARDSVEDKVRGLDAGAEVDGYAGDITRTFPVNGQFSKAQQAVYEVVLNAQYAAIEATKPGARFNDPHDAAVKVLAQG